MSGGELSSAATRHPWDWYVDESWCAEKLIETLQGPLCGGYEDWFCDDLVWDPCCGMGNTLRPFIERGHPVAGSDIDACDAQGVRARPAGVGRAMSCNQAGDDVGRALADSFGQGNLVVNALNAIDSFRLHRQFLIIQGASKSS